MCTPEHHCNSRLRYKSFDVKLSCGWFNELVEILGGLFVLLVIFLLVCLCILVKYIKWRRDENLKVETY